MVRVPFAKRVPMFNPSPQQLKYVKGVLFVSALIPAARLIWGAFHDGLGANPVEFITRNTGDWTLYLLCLTLAITPMRRMLNWPWLLKLRRMLGLFAFFYAFLHFTAFFWFDHFFAVDEMLKDVFKRPFILVGFIAFLGLLPLAATSTNRMIKLLGGKRWQALHKTVYAIAVLGVLHYWWMKAGKNDFEQPALFALIVAILLGARMYWHWRGRRKESAV